MCDFFDLVKKSKCRAIPEVRLDFFSNYRFVIEKLIKQEVVDIGSYTPQYMSELERTGIVTLGVGGVEFSSALTRSVFISRYYTVEHEISYTIDRFDYDIEDLVIQAVKKISSQRIRDSLSTNKQGERYESFYQCEFYRHIIPLLSYLGIVGYYPDVGKVFGSKGKLDFYLNRENQWGIEIVRDNNLLAEHFGRFSKYGIYRKIPMKRWVVLHFLMLSKEDLPVIKKESMKSKKESMKSKKETSKMEESEKEKKLPNLRTNEVQVIIIKESLEKKKVDIIIRTGEKREDTTFDD
jgi:hypothetical protein